MGSAAVPPATKRVLMIGGDYMEDLEAVVPLHALLAFGASVDCVSPGKAPGDKCPTAVHEFLGFELYTELPGHTFHLNANFDDADPDAYDALIIPGGRFTDLLSAHEPTLKLTSRFVAAGKPIMTTCHSQLILAAASGLKGTRCAAFPSMKIAVELAGGVWADPFPISSAVLDRNVVSAIGWPAHAETIRLFLQAMGARVVFSNGRSDPSVLFLCGDYVEDYEINVPFRALGGLGCRVEAACPSKKKGDACVTSVLDDEGRQVCSERRGHNFIVTVDWAEALAGDYDCLVIPGGRSPELLVGDSSVVELVREFAEKGKTVAAVGQGQLVLAAAGVLKGRKTATGYGMKAIVKLSGGEVSESAEESMADGKVVTATGWSSLPNFVSDLMNQLGLTVAF